MKITIEIDKNNTIHSTIDCQGRDFDKTLHGIMLAINELNIQVVNRNKCPMSKTSSAPQWLKDQMERSKERREKNPPTKEIVGRQFEACKRLMEPINEYDPEGWRS